MEMSKESIMVCVHYGPHGQRLIQRGSQLAGLLQAPLIVLTVGALGDNEYNREKQQYLSGWKDLTESAGGQFVIRDGNGKSVSEVIADTARENHITQIIIGQSGQTFWEGLTRGYFINDLLELLGPIDLHIVAVQRYPELLEQTHERGVKAYLVFSKDRYVLAESAEDSNVNVMKGVFFRELHTDFNTGLFKIVKDGEAQYLRIVQNEWVKPH